MFKLPLFVTWKNEKSNFLFNRIYLPVYRYICWSIMNNNWRFCSSRQTSVLAGMIQKDLPIVLLSRWSSRTYMGIASPLTHWEAGEHLAVLDHTTKSTFLLSITRWDPQECGGDLHSEIGALCNDGMGARIQAGHCSRKTALSGKLKIPQQLHLSG